MFRELLDIFFGSSRWWRSEIATLCKRSVIFLSLLFWLFFCVPSTCRPLPESGLQSDEQPLSMSKFLSRPVALSVTENAWLKMQQTVRVTVGPWPPYSYWEKGAKGIGVDYLKLLAEKFGFKVVFQQAETSWSETLKKFAQLDGPDLMLAMTNTPERQKHFLFTQDYLFGIHALITLKNRSLYTQLSDLQGQRLAVVKDYEVHRLLVKKYPGINLLLCNNDLEKLEAVSTGRADACVSVVAVATYLIQKFSLNNLKMAAPVPFPRNCDAMAVRRDWPELVSIINKGLNAFLPKEHNQIRQKNIAVRFNYGFSFATLAAWVGGVVFLASLLILIFFVANRKLRREIELRCRIEVELREALAEVKTLQGFIPICGACHKIRDDKGYWQRLETYLQEHSEASFSHGLCPDCAMKFLGDWNLKKKLNSKTI